MLENILSLFAAFVTIFIADFLVKKQKERHNISENLKQEIKDSLESIANEVEILTGEQHSLRTLEYLENRIEVLNECLRLIKKPKHVENEYKEKRRKIKRGKNKRRSSYD